MGKTYNHGVLITEKEYQIIGNGNSNTISEYNYYLENVNNKYVELWQTDYDGTTKKLNTQYISCSSEDDLIVVSPNPVNENEIVKIKGNIETIKIYDILGKEINAQIIENKIYGLNSGIYIIIVNNQYRVKLIVK
jgi:hypothetical protein